MMFMSLLPWLKFIQEIISFMFLPKIHKPNKEEAKPVCWVRRRSFEKVKSFVEWKWHKLYYAKEPQSIMEIIKMRFCVS